MSERVPAETFSPGDYLTDELEARGWSQADFADIIGRPAPVVNQIIKGKRSVTPDLAKELSAALGTSAMFWLKLEAAYRLQNEQDQASPQIRRRALLRERFAVRLMINRKWIASSKDPEELTTQVMRFYDITALDEVPTLRHAAKRTGYPGDLNQQQLAWLFRVKRIAEARAMPAYSERDLRAAIAEMHNLLLVPEGVQQVPKMLHECGVRLVIVEHVPASKIDGVCFWLDSRSPVVGMSLRLDRIDNFWFVLRHELEHVLNKHGMDEAIVDSESDLARGDVNEEERIANAAGADFCVPEAAMSDFILRNDPLFSEEKVIGFARRMQVHPGLVVGQLQRRTGRWNLFRHQLQKIRGLIAPFAVTDGYGQTVPAV